MIEEFDVVADIITDGLDRINVTKLFDLNLLYESFLKSMKNSSWKSSCQRYELQLLSNLVELSKSIRNRTYTTDKTTEFVLNERGKTRYIHGNTIRDRIIRHNLCDNILTPLLSKYLIYNNGASQTGKGISFQRKQFEKHLHNFYLKYYHNQGYILFIDFSKFYDNILHSKVKELISPLLDDDCKWLFEDIIDSFRVDISDYPQVNPTDMFDSIKFHSLDKIISETDERRVLEKGINIGDQTSQNIGIYYPTRIDTYVTNVRHHKWYGRYMDDSYIISDSKDELLITLHKIEEIAREYGVFINERKTRIVETSSTYKFLQVNYSLTNTGGIIKRINPKSVTKEKHRLKAYKRLLENGILSYNDIENTYKSWLCSYYRMMSKIQIQTIQDLYESLFGVRPRYKKWKSLNG